jgi:hypothetical protein
MDATVNIPEQELLPGEVFVRSDDDNFGLLEFLISEGIVSKSKYSFRVGFGCTIIYVVDLLITDL